MKFGDQNANIFNFAEKGEKLGRVSEKKEVTGNYGLAEEEAETKNFYKYEKALNYENDVFIFLFFFPLRTVQDFCSVPRANVWKLI